MQSDKPVLIITVYMPFDTKNNESLTEYSDSLVCLYAIVADNDVESVIILRNFNTNTDTALYNEPMAFCLESELICMYVY